MFPTRARDPCQSARLGQVSGRWHIVYLLE